MNKEILIQQITCILSFGKTIVTHSTHLRIDNSRRGRIHSLWDISRTTKASTSCDISNERADFSACVDISDI